MGPQPPKSTEPRRWRLVQGTESLHLLTLADGPAVDPHRPIDVMPVSEHEEAMAGAVPLTDYVRTVGEWSQRVADEVRKARRLREAAQAVVDWRPDEDGSDRQLWDAIQRLRAAVEPTDHNEEGT